MLRPLRNNVLLRPVQTESQHASGLILTNSIDNLAHVMAVGCEVKELKVGDAVRYDKASAVNLDGYLMCRELDVLCVVE